MGPRYANPIIPMILAAGFFFPSVQWSSTRILVGLNAHGRAGLGELVASIGSVGLAFLMLGVLRWGLVGAALAVTLPLTVMNVIYLPYLICRRLRLGVKRYFMSALIRPAVYVLPFALCLAAARIGFNSRPLVGLACGGAVGSVLLAVLYYKRVLPQRIKKCMNRIVGLRRSLA